MKVILYYAIGTNYLIQYQDGLPSEFEIITPQNLQTLYSFEKLLGVRLVSAGVGVDPLVAIKDQIIKMIDARHPDAKRAIDCFDCPLVEKENYKYKIHELYERLRQR